VVVPIFLTPLSVTSRTHVRLASVPGMDPLSVLLLAAILIGWVGLFALWWFGFRGKGED
jgi:hypothetical protein